jgi:hypothetical protein
MIVANCGVTSLTRCLLPYEAAVDLLLGDTHTAPIPYFSLRLSTAQPEAAISK